MFLIAVKSNIIPKLALFLQILNIVFLTTSQNLLFLQVYNIFDIADKSEIPATKLTNFGSSTYILYGKLPVMRVG